MFFQKTQSTQSTPSESSLPGTPLTVPLPLVGATESLSLPPSTTHIMPPADPSPRAIHAFAPFISCSLDLTP